MKKVMFEETENPVSLDNIKLLEKKFAFILPDVYKKHLIMYNGGYPTKDIFPLIEPIWHDIKRGGVAATGWFLAVHGDRDTNLENTIKSVIDRIPQDVIPISTTPGGDLICLCVKGVNYGKVYYWDHNWEAEDSNIPTYDNMYLIADNFTDFINSLYSSGVKRQEDDSWVIINTHDKHSLPLSIHAKKYGYLVTDFFTNAPSEVEDYVIEEHEATKDVVFYYDVKSEGKRYKRTIKADSTVQDSIE